MFNLSILFVTGCCYTNHKKLCVYKILHKQYINTPNHGVRTEGIVVIWDVFLFNNILRVVIDTLVFLLQTQYGYVYKGPSMDWSPDISLPRNY